MLDIQFIRDHADRVRTAMQQKGIGDGSLVDQVLAADTERRELIAQTQDTQTRSNAAAREIGTLMKEGRKEEAQAAIAESSQLKATLKELEEKERLVQEKVDALLLEVPNVPHDSVPVGRTPADNVVAFEWGTPREFDFEAVPHWDLLDRHDLADFDRGSKVTGAGFPFYRGPGARLQRALINFFLDEAVQAGYVEIQAPLVVNADSARGTGQLPDKEDMMYEAKKDGLYLIPTAEVPVTNLHRDEIFGADQLPIRYCAYTPCFRREAGSYGKDVRGLNRLHQFDKVELVHFVRPEDSYQALEDLREHAESLLRKLELPYRRLLMCTGDMGFTQAKKYDLEVWSAAQARWLEVSSISNFESFQARRMMIRYRAEQTGKPQIIHTLNGSGLALPRIVAALLENNQQADGSITVPAALRPYFGSDAIG
ncbi:MAG: serine--tRNA ligase [Bacteroidetes bacterium]|nr:serine--tRNA ligase [Bacteroidota bacterium]MDA0875548.1 serine--tRNA ligase [Bacteroidota bacterium]